MKEVAKVVDALLKSGARKATLFLSKSQVIKASRPAFRGDKMRGAFRKGLSRFDIVLTIGKPNYDERETLRKAKGMVPKGVGLKFLPKKK